MFSASTWPGDNTAPRVAISLLKTFSRPFLFSRAVSIHFCAWTASTGPHNMAAIIIQSANFML